MAVSIAALNRAGAQWVGFAFGAFAAAAALLWSVPAAASDPQSRAETPEFNSVFSALAADASGYRICVDEGKAGHLAAMWERRAPIDAAIYDLSLAYRNCDGFDRFWRLLYFQGFDSPEQWIGMEIEAIKIAAMRRAETDVQTMRDARAFLRKASDKNSALAKLSARDRKIAKEELARMAYVVDALRPRTEAHDEFEPVVTESAERLLAFLPEDAEERLAEALEFAKREDDDAERVLRGVRRSLNTRR